MRAQLLPPLSPGRTPCGTGRHLDQPCRLSLRHPRSPSPTPIAPGLNRSAESAHPKTGPGGGHPRLRGSVPLLSDDRKEDSAALLTSLLEERVRQCSLAAPIRFICDRIGRHHLCVTTGSESSRVVDRRRNITSSPNISRSARFMGAIRLETVNTRVS
jgi:hypothetical protein